MQTKRCSKCKVVKPLSEFCKKSASPTGRVSACKVCNKIYRDSRKEENAAKQKVYYEANREDYKVKNKIRWAKNKAQNKIKSRTKHLWVSYGMTDEQHMQMYVGQDGCCLLCEQTVEYSKVHTDHDHNTGRVRGLLCARCNLGMCFVDDADFMQRAADYV